MAHVCVLATVDQQGRPQARTLVLRNVDHNGSPRLALFINANSPKWAELANSNSACVQVYWPSVELQYRMQVQTEALDPKVVAASWQFRPDAPKKMDWLYQQQAQSTAVADRAQLLKQLDQLATPEPLVAPEAAKGLLIQVTEIERLDLTQSNGVHDRTLYTLRQQGQEGQREWYKQTLVP
jgi:pyridoxine/pyridoxamine 5'-phosphate oxidase